MTLEQGVLFSISPEHCMNILTGDKTLEIRKSKVTLPTPFRGFVYCTKNGSTFSYYSEKRHNTGHQVANGKVIAEFTCDQITIDVPEPDGYLDLYEGSCLTSEQLMEYGSGHILYGYHISDLKIYDKFKPITAFYRRCITSPECLCPDCRYQRIIIPEDEISTDFYDETCMNTLKRPPQSWQYVWVNREES